MSDVPSAISSRAPLVYITGASSGIGQALARQYYELGYSLALVARRVDAMHQWAQESGLDAQRYAVYQADVMDIESACTAGCACLELQGVPDIVIANAGISWGVDTSKREDLDAMQQVLASNTMGLAASFQPFIVPMMKRGSGSLVGIASIAGIRGLPGHGAYCASKAAVIAYCESLRTELQEFGVSVITLLPGYVDTPLTQNNPYPMPFLLTPQEFAKRAYRAIERKSRYVIIPWQMAVTGRLMRWLPAFIWDRLVSGRTRKPRHLGDS